MRRLSAALLIAAALPTGIVLANGGSEGTAPAFRPPQAPSDCGAEAHADLVGQPVAQAEALAGTLPGPVRIHPVGAMLTMDYLPHRLNIAHDADGIVVSVRCG